MWIVAVRNKRKDWNVTAKGKPDFWSGNEGKKLHYSLKSARADGVVHVVPFVQYLRCWSSRWPEAPWAAPVTLEFCGKTRKWREIWQCQTHLGAVRGVPRENVKSNWKKLISDRIEEPKSTKVCSGSIPAAGLYSQLVEKKLWQTAVGWRVDSVITKNRVKHLS